MTKKSLSLGKQRGLSQCANDQFVFNILALDHRGVLRRAFSDSPDPYAESVKFKRSIVKALSPSSTAILLDNSIGGEKAHSQPPHSSLLDLGGKPWFKDAVEMPLWDAVTRVLDQDCYESMVLFHVRGSRQS